MPLKPRKPKVPGFHEGATGSSLTIANMPLAPWWTPEKQKAKPKNVNKWK